MVAFEENINVCSCRENMLRTTTKTGEWEQQSCREAGVQLGKLFTLKADSDREKIGSWDLGQRYLDAPESLNPTMPLKPWAWKCVSILLTEENSSFLWLQMAEASTEINALQNYTCLSRWAPFLTTRPAWAYWQSMPLLGMKGIIYSKKYRTWLRGMGGNERCAWKWSLKCGRPEGCMGRVCCLGACSWP